ncbi:unnamed protein product [Prorocentrum cordatum]|uniref:Uncharacterized protein n=1 Tax=Prorocentrum cordatum TaxID=2364126 RepID=A0ABN9PZ97_9DINO|nr:unnamed protein product [Polarella glacialis]CAK0851905.1 unnamed protein product [Polarella glacialis]
MYDGWSKIITPPPRSPAPSTAGPSVSHVGAGVRATTAIDEHATERGSGFIFAVAKDWKPKVPERRIYSMMGNGARRSFWMLTGNCAHEHARGIRGFPNVELRPGRNPNLAVADGAPLGYYASKTMTLYIAGDSMEFQVTDVKQLTRSAGKFCSRAENSVARHDGKGGLPRRETAGLVKLKTINHYALERWTNMFDDMEEQSQQRDQVKRAKTEAQSSEHRQEGLEFDRQESGSNHGSYLEELQMHWRMRRQKGQWQLPTIARR